MSFDLNRTTRERRMALLEAITSGLPHAVAGRANDVLWEAQDAGWANGATVEQIIAAGKAAVETRAAVERLTATPGAATPALPAEASHYELASAYVSEWKDMVFAQGALWIADKAGIWTRHDFDHVISDVGRRFGGFKLCKRGSDYKQIAQLICSTVSDDKFFDSAPAGIASPAGFWRIDDDGQVVREDLTPDHRQRFRLSVDPNPDAPRARFDALLHDALGDDEQIELLQLLFGGALTQRLSRMKIAALLIGASDSGKTTLLRILRAVFPREVVGATSPQKWGNEYYVAGLAGKVLNVVGELDKHEAIPGGAFKSVVGGGDVIEGRHPTHRPFTFTPTAAHFFNANGFPPTLDRSDAFFNRWRILVFDNPVDPAKKNSALVEQVFEHEIGAVVAWMLEGAAKLVRRGELPVTPKHTAALEKWRAGNNTALQFLLDPEACSLDVEFEISGQDLFNAYQCWAHDAGLRAFGRNGFYDALKEGAGRLRVMVKDTPRPVTVLGVALAPRWMR